jgi:hypothetical protein
LAYDRKVLRSCASAVWMVMALHAVAQNRPTQEPPAAEQPSDQYFSGTVVSLDEEKLTVARTVLGKNTSSRSFIMSADTLIEGKLKIKARVTVKFVSKDDIDRAVHIIVRNPTPKK